MTIHRFVPSVALAVLLPLAAAPLAAGVAAPRFAVGPEERIPVAFVLTEDAVMIDWAGPWEVFQDVHLRSRGASMEAQMPFRLFTVSDSKTPFRTSDGLQVTPDYTFDDAPAPRIVVVPAQSGDSPKMLAWLRAMAGKSDIVMSVCTGAFQLAEAGLLSGRPATTHHDAFASFAHVHPDVHLERGRRWVESGPHVFTAGGLSSGIDLALHVVELYFGRETAIVTARHMEYEGKGWMGDGKAAEDFGGPLRFPHPSDGLASGPFGNWQGTLDAGDATFAVALHLWKTPDGAPVGTIDSFADDAFDMPLDGATFAAPALRFDVPSVPGTFEGKLSADGATIEGSWTEKGKTLPLVFHRAKG